MGRLPQEACSVGAGVGLGQEVRAIAKILGRKEFVNLWLRLWIE
jgi:hypothetical protein